MQQRLHVRRRDDEVLRIEPENLVLAFVPHPVAVDPVPIPGTHLAGGNGKAAALLALDQPLVRFLELRRAGADAVLQLGVEPLELSRFAVELGEHLDLGTQHLGDDGHWHVIHRAHLVAAQPIEIADLDRRDEDDRGLAEARVLADHRGELEAVELGHADVDEDDGNLVLQSRYSSASRPDDATTRFSPSSFSITS